MTVPSETNRSGPYNGNGVTTVFDYGFRILDEDHLRVIKKSALGTETVLVIDTDYTVSDVGEPAGGSVTLDEAPETGETITILRSIPFVQETDLENQGAYYAETVEDALDLAVMRDQQIDEELARTLQVPASYGDDVNPTLPIPDANKLIGWNEAADGLQNVDASLLASIIAYGTANADIFTGDGVETEFALSADPAAINNLDVAIGGVTQLPGVDYTWSSGTTITFTSPPADGVKILVRYMQALAQGATNADLVSTPDGTVQAALNARPIRVTSRTTLKALNVTRFSMAFLDEGARQGFFTLIAGATPADALEGIYIASDTAGYYWARVWDGTTGRPEWFGAVIDDNTERTATLAALNACSSLCPATALGHGTYYTNGVWRISGADPRAVEGVGRSKSVVSSNHATAHILHVGGTVGAHYQERPKIEGVTLHREVQATVPADPNDDAAQGHGLHMRMTSNATVREVDTTGGNLVGIYWANALSPLWDDCFDLMQQNGARAYSWMVDGTEDDGLGPAFPSLIVFRGEKLRQSNAGASALSRGLLVLGSYTDTQIDKVETAGCHNGALLTGSGSNAHFNSHWHDAYKADGFKIDKTGAGGGENITVLDLYAAPGVGATGQPLTVINAQNVQVKAAQITSYPGGGDGKIGVLFEDCVNCTFEGMVVNHSTGVRLDGCYGCEAVAGISKFTGTGIDGMKVEGGYGNAVEPTIVGVSGSVNFGTGVALASTGGNSVDLTRVLDSAVTNRLTIDGGVVAGAGNVSTQNFVIRPGATFATAAT